MSARIDDATGLDVEVMEASARDEQTDRIEGENDEDEETIREALAGLWESLCAEGAAPAPVRKSEA